MLTSLNAAKLSSTFKIGSISTGVSFINSPNRSLFEVTFKSKLHSFLVLIEVTTLVS